MTRTCPNWVSYFRLSILGYCLLVLAACGPSTDTTKDRAQVEVLKRDLAAVTLERDSLRKQVSELSETPPYLFAKVAEFVGQGKLQDAERALKAIAEKHPKAPETGEAQKAVDALRVKQDRQLAEQLRLDALGFKALKTTPVIDTGNVRVSIGVPALARRFTFDRYNSSYHYRDADRDQKFVVIGLSATAPKGVSNPDLPGFAIYSVDGKQLRKIEKFDLEFVRWEDYATYLGNYSDSGNDFAKNATIPFAIGAQASDEQLAKRPLYIVATKTGCLSRQYERFKSPPDYYRGACTDLAETIDLAVFASENGKLTLVRRID